MNKLPTPISLLRSYFILLFIEGLLALLQFFLLPIDIKKGILLGLSWARLTMIGGTAFLLLVIVVMIYLVWRDTRITRRLISFLNTALRWDSIYLAILCLCILTTLASIYYYLFLFKVTDSALSAYLLRLSPFVFWVALGALQTLFSVRIWRFGFELDGTPKQSKTFLSSIIVYIILLSITAFISLSRIGLTQDIHVSLNWGDPGTPLMSLQIFGAYLASISVFLFYLLLTSFPKVRDILQKPIFLDSVIFLLLWILASWLWLAEPIHPTYFAPKPRLPNFEVYPYSDAGNYDSTAQYLLAGNGICLLYTSPSPRD